MAKTEQSSLAIILAAGQGTRMKSEKPKVLHEIAGLPMLGHVLNAVRSAGVDSCAVVLGPQMDDAAGFVDSIWPDAQIFEQTERLGTAHAVMAAREAYLKSYDEVLILYGDVPLISADAINALRAPLRQGAAVSVYGFRPAEPGRYGRLITQGGQLAAIREAKDATEDELKIGFCNSGLMGFDGRHVDRILNQIDNQNAQNEFYLTDAVEVANKSGLSVTAIEGRSDEVAGVNTLAELAKLERQYQDKKREEFLLSGVAMQAPETVWFSHDTQVASGVVIEPNVIFGLNVKVEAGARIRAFSHLEDCAIDTSAIAGPYARIRPGTRIGKSARIGNFVEVKNASIEDGAKVNHLSYIGDASVGAGSNIGAGTITCNYDGVNKFQTTIGEGAFVGSNSALVAPLTIGDGAYIASGSVITQDVEPSSLAFGRSRQTNKPGRAPKPEKI